MIERVIEREGGFVDHPADRGGPTNMGITQATLGAWLGEPASVEQVRELREEVAAEIYRDKYFEGPSFDKLKGRWHEYVFDAAVHHGPRAAGKFVQRVCNEWGKGEPVKVDAIVGPKTIRAAFLVSPNKVRGGMWLQRMVRFVDIVESNPSQRVFLMGWMNRINELHEVPMG